MIHSVKFTCVLDTNVIYPIEIRDMLFWFAHFELYTPKWSAHIFDEWKDIMARKGVPEVEIIKRVEKANEAFPDALVSDYEALITFLSLPDSKDRHVLAAAIKANANVIVYLLLFCAKRRKKTFYTTPSIQPDWAYIRRRMATIHRNLE